MSAPPRFWQTRAWQACLLWPLSCLFSILLRIRRLFYQLGILKTVPSRLPVVVVGNLSVGGTGKTPLCAELVKYFQQAGWKPAIVSRGYGGQRHDQPYLLKDGDSSAIAGDEPVMLYEQTGVPVCVCIDRAAAVEEVAQQTNADVVFSDDGLQHLRMERVADIVVIDSARGFGNRWLMPAGPLREPCSRLAQVDLIAIQNPFTEDAEPASDGSVMHSSLGKLFSRFALGPVQQQTFQLRPGLIQQLRTGHTVELAAWNDCRVHAVAGIGNPQRFFDSLSAHGLQVEPHPKPDHFQLTLADLSFDDDCPVLLTSKDAVKVKGLPNLPETVYEVSTQIHLSDSLKLAIAALERSLRS